MNNQLALHTVAADDSGITLARRHGEPELPDGVLGFIRDSLSTNTRKAYLSDLAHYEAWGGKIPSTPETIASYLAEHAGSLTPATLARRIVSISKAHHARGFNNPTSAVIVRATMRGIRRRLGTAQRRAKALLRDDLFALLDKLGERPKDIRDRAMILIGFATAMRRSELVALNVEDVEFVTKGALVTILRSKTDQEGKGRKIAVPHGRARHCPVAAIKAWLAFAGISAGPIFLAVNKHGHTRNHRISGEAVSDVIKTRIQAAGYDPAAFSGHSLRSGFATAAAQAGASMHKIKQTTGHRNDASLALQLRFL